MYALIMYKNTKVKKKKKTDPQGVIDKATNIVGNFNTHLLLIDRQCRPTSVGK